MVRSPPGRASTTTGTPATGPAKATTPGAAARTAAPGPARRSTPRCPAAQGSAGGSNPRSAVGRPRAPGPATGQHRAPGPAGSEHPSPTGTAPGTASTGKALGTALTGNYEVETLLIANSSVLAKQQTAFEVVKTGFEAFIAVESRRHALYYGFAVAFLAIVAGVIANLLFRRE